MKTDPILREKWRVQRELACEANHDITRYLGLVEKYVADWAISNHVKLKYADVSQLPVRRMKIAEAPAEYLVASPHHKFKPLRQRVLQKGHS